MSTLSIGDLVSFQDRAPSLLARRPIKTSAPSLLSQAFSIASTENEKVPAARQVRRSAVQEVVTREYSRFRSLDKQARDFAVLRAVNLFISTEQHGLTASGLVTPHTDLLSAGNPVAQTSLTASAVSEKRAEWLAGHPDLSARIRPVVAAAFAAEPGSVQLKHAAHRVLAQKHGTVPLEIVTELEQRLGR
jgi:hypothetical protein